MTRRRIRAVVAVPVLAGLAAFLMWGLVGMPDFGHYRGPYGYVLNRIAVPQRHTTNVVTAVVFDYRGFDTMGEEFILFGAVTGVVLLLRKRGEDERPEREQKEEKVVDRVTSDVLRVVGIAAVGIALLVGLWLVAFGFVTPGGGFQGGVLIAGAVLLVYVATSYHAWRRISRDAVLDPLEGLGVGTYAALGVATLVAGGPFLHNFLGPGSAGTLLSGGSLPFLNLATAIEVAAANVLLFAELLERYVAPLARSSR